MPVVETAPGDLARLIASARGGKRSYLTPEGTRVARFEHQGRDVLFCISDIDDRVQRKQTRGKFYEQDELTLIARYFPKDGVFCDIGTNVGNHSVYALMFLQASKAICFEPNPGAYQLLIANAVLNGLMDKFDFSHLGFGVGETAQDGLAMVLRDGNLGATRLVESADAGGISVRSADSMLGDTRVDFIKLDVEGMEIQVLNGLKETVRRCQPPIMLELEHENREVFDQWMTEMGYKVFENIREFRHCRNLLIAPVGYQI